MTQGKEPKYPNLFQPSHTYFQDGKGGEYVKTPSFKALLPIYGVALELVWGHNGVLKNAKGYTQNCGENSYLIVITSKQDGTLVHELEHLVELISKDLQIDRGETSEAQAYLIGYLFEEIKKVV